jgi:hypothetical protein
VGSMSPDKIEMGKIRQIFTFIIARTKKVFESEGARTLRNTGKYLMDPMKSTSKATTQNPFNNLSRTLLNL